MGVARKSKPCCDSCGHAISFHGSGEHPCRALGCSCKRYVGLSNVAASTVTVAEACELLDATRGWVMENVEEFNGREIPNNDLSFGGRKRTGKTLRLDLDKIERFLAREARKAEKAVV